MKKILILILIILLLILAYVFGAKGLKLGFVKVNSIKDIKQESADLDSNYSKANELAYVTYPSEIEELESAIKSLKESNNYGIYRYI